MSPIRVVARREIVERTRDRAFAIGTVITLLILAAVIVLPDVFGGGRDRVTVAPAGAEAQRVLAAADRADRLFDVELLATGDRASADIVLGPDGILERGDPPEGAVGALQAASARERAERALEGTGIDPAVLDPPPLRVRSTDEDADAMQGFAIIALIVLYGQLITFGLWVATGIVEEKASRIVEILLAAIRPRELLAGKVLGIGIVGFLQLLLIGAVALALAAATGRADVGARELSTLPVVLGWFVLGYAFYACAFAMVGALVPRQEDIQTAGTPVMIAILASFFLSFDAASNPGGTLAQVLGYMPFSAPLVMPVRMIAGDVAIWEAALSVSITVAGTLALVVLAGRVYGAGVLRTAGVMRLRDALGS